MGRQPCCDKVGLKRGPWTIEEDNKLMNFILNNGIQCWRLVPKLAGLMRCGKSCRLRWINYLRPDLKRGAWTEAEEDMVIQLHSRLGNRWSKIAAHFPGRTDNEIKNHWNTKIKKKLKLLGLDPLTHKPIEISENCDKKDEGIQGYSSSGEQEIIIKPEFQETPLSKDFQMQHSDETPNTKDFQMQQSDETPNTKLDDQKNGGISDSTLNQENNLACKFNEMKTCPEMGSTFVTNTEPLDSFYLGMADSNHCLEDSFHNWVNSPLPWDIFTSLEDNFL